MPSPPAPDRLLLHGLCFLGHHGVSSQEREMGGEYRVDLDVETVITAAAASDRLEDTTDYVRLCRVVQEVVEERSFALLEALAEAIAEAVLAVPGVDRVRLRVTKPARLPVQSQGFAVEVCRPR